MRLQSFIDQFASWRPPRRKESVVAVANTARLVEDDPELARAAVVLLAAHRLFVKMIDRRGVTHYSDGTE